MQTRLLNRHQPQQLAGARAQPCLRAALPRPRLLARAAAAANGPNLPLAAAAPSAAPKPRLAPKAPAPAAAAPADAAAAAPAPADPLAAATPTPHWQAALDEIDRKGETGRIVVVQVAPAVRVAISEALGKPPGSVTTGQLVAALRALGFDFVFDTLFGADLTIMEEGTELLERLAAHMEAAKRAREAGAAGAAAAAAAAAASSAPPPPPPPPMPMFTSCCPGWVAMVEKSNPELIPYLSSCKSPQMMLGAVIKNYFASAAGKAADEVVSVSVMPCVRKQGEADRPWFSTAAGAGARAAAAAARDVDHVITTVELARILQQRGIDPELLEEREFDAPLGEGSGGGQLFGTTGGVMEAALRTVAEIVTGKKMDALVYEGVRGLEGVKEATVSLEPGVGTPFYELMMAAPSPPTKSGAAAAAARGEEDGAWVEDGAAAPSAPPPPPLEIRVAVANGLGNAKKLVKAMAEGASQYDFVEVMACPGGCIGGGGQPRSADKLIAQKRQAAIYAIDGKKALRRPHENAFVQRLYADYLGKPGSGLAHELLHTHYVKGGVEGADKE